MPQNYIGCDISKDRLDVLDPRSGASAHANTVSGIKALIKACGSGSVLIFEATSGCDQVLLTALAKADQPFVRLNPLHAWHFAQSLNLPKTDRVDARMLARLGAERQPAPHLAQDPARAELAELADRRDQLKRMETQEKNRLTKTVSPLIRADIRASLKALAARIARFEAEIADHLARHPDLARDAALLRSIPGVGPVTAANLLARLPELGQLDRRAIASLAGLAPKARDSGKFRGQRRIGQGRDVVRRLLYMSALSLWRTPGPTTTALRRMQDAGKPAKVILIAMARKIVTVANAVLRDQTPFRTPMTT
jgi:transposase